MGCLQSTWDSMLARILRLVLFPLCLYLIDVITDLALAVQYYYSGDFTWFGLTLGFVLGPTIIANILLAWLTEDSEMNKYVKYLLRVLQLSVFMEYCNIFRLLLRGEVAEIHVENSLPIAHLFEAMLESIPQLCLQLYIIISTGEQVSVLQVITMVASLLAAVKAVVTYWYYTNNEADRTFSCGFVTRFLLLTLWKVFEISTRVLAVGLFASALKPWIALPIAVHWLIMTVTYIWIGEDYRTCSMMMFAPLIMAVDTFSMTGSFDHKRTFWLNTVLTLLGNITMVTAWYTLKTGQDWYDVPALVGVRYCLCDSYFNIFYLLLRGEDVEEHVKENLPIAHLLEAMLESVPQLCLQLYIIISTGEQVSVLKVITMVISLLAAVKAVVTFWYYNTDEADRTFSCGFVTRLILFAVWKVFELSARVLDVGLFASAFKPWIALPIGVHWLIMTVTYICIDEASRDCIGMIFAALYMSVDTFSMTGSMDLKRTFRLNTVLTLLGNITMVTVWYALKTGQDWYDVPALVGVVVGSVVSAGFGFIEMVFRGKIKSPFTSCCK
ncbi:XK-related protein 6-like [Branchiostoma floridae x Branchiostoma japonicum]